MTLSFLSLSILLNVKDFLESSILDEDNSVLRNEDSENMRDFDCDLFNTEDAADTFAVLGRGALVTGWLAY